MSEHKDDDPGPAHEMGTGGDAASPAEPAERPEVQRLMKELSAGLAPGEDPLFYQVPAASPAPAPGEPGGAEDLRPPDVRQEHHRDVAPVKAHHVTVENAKVKIAERARNPERLRPTLKIERPQVAAQAAAAAMAAPHPAASPVRPAVLLALGLGAAAVVAVTAWLVLGTRPTPPEATGAPPEAAGSTGARATAGPTPATSAAAAPPSAPAAAPRAAPAPTEEATAAPAPARPAPAAKPTPKPASKPAPKGTGEFVPGAKPTF
ncbi:MAG: hypothetical protein HY744_13535 [Deltaproteobacteria bacterium]|nr:hypothetical protein [Deltaproteobacteria bacterium]